MQVVDRTDEELIVLRSRREVERIRDAARIVVRTLEELRQAVGPGTTTLELDQLAGQVLRESGAVSGSLGYQGYPGHICVSVNEEVIHGIGGPRRLRDGDIVKLDVAASYRGYFADSTVTLPVGKIRPEVTMLLKVTEEALNRGIAQAWPGNHLSDISHAIQRYVERSGFSVVRAYGGHGVGRQMHEAPWVPHFGSPHRGPLLRPGMVFAVEPQVNMGTREIVLQKDHWTAVTRDRRLSAHFEHTIAIGPEGPEVLTRREL